MSILEVTKEIINDIDSLKNKEKTINKENNIDSLNTSLKNHHKKNIKNLK